MEKLFDEKLMQAIAELGEIAQLITQLKEVLPPITIKTLKIKDKEYIAILIEKVKK